MWRLAGSLRSLDWIAWSGQIGLLAVDSGYPNLARGRVRLRRTLCATDANRDPSRLTAVYPPPRKPLACIRRRSWTLRARSKLSCHGPPRWTRFRCRQPKSITWSLAACRSPPSVQLTPKVLVRQALSRSDRPARPYRVMAPGPKTRGATLPDSVTVDSDTWSRCSGRATTDLCYHFFRRATPSGQFTFEHRACRIASDRA